MSRFQQNANKCPMFESVRIGNCGEAGFVDSRNVISSCRQCVHWHNGMCSMLLGKSRC